MSVLTRSKVRSRQPLATVASPRANPPGRASASSSELPQQSSNEGGVNCSNRIVGGCSSTLAAGNMWP